MSMTILAGDIGGTTTRLGLFEAAVPRPRPLVVRSFATLDHAGLGDVLAAFLAECRARGGSVPVRIDAASFGVAGPIVGETARLTNAPWTIDIREIATRLGFKTIFHFSRVFKQQTGQSPRKFRNQR